MKKIAGIIMAVLGTIAFVPAQSPAGWVLYDNFDSGRINPNKWDVDNSSATISVENGKAKFVHTVGHPGDSSRLSFKHPEMVKGIKATITVASASGDLDARLAAHVGLAPDGNPVWQGTGALANSNEIYVGSVVETGTTILSDLFWSSFRYPITCIGKSYTLQFEYSKLPQVNYAVQGQGSSVFTHPDGTITPAYDTLCYIGTKSSNGNGYGTVYFDNVYIYTTSGTDNLVSRYNFTYYYNDGSNDHYSGYVIGFNGDMSTGELHGTTSPLGSFTINGNGYYTIDSIEHFDGSLMDVGKVYITEYFDGDTGKTSDTIYIDRNGKTSQHELYTGAGGLGAEKGYVFDPSVPDDDAYFGGFDVTYFFSPSATSHVNFLAAYIKDLPYWNQPHDFPGSCDEVAGSIILAYWYQHGCGNFLTKLWGDNSEADYGYIALIGDLAIRMYYLDLTWEIPGTHYVLSDEGATLFPFVGPGLTNYMKDHQCDFDRDGDWGGLTLSWSELKNSLSDGQPCMISISGNFPRADGGGHMVVARGYWNDKRITCNFGWGSNSKRGDNTKLTNVCLKWNSSTAFSYYAEDNNKYDITNLSIRGIIRYWPK